MLAPILVEVIERLYPSIGSDIRDFCHSAVISSHWFGTANAFADGQEKTLTVVLAILRRITAKVLRISALFTRNILRKVEVYSHRFILKVRKM